MSNVKNKHNRVTVTKIKSITGITNNQFTMQFVSAPGHVFLDNISNPDIFSTNNIDSVHIFIANSLQLYTNSRTTKLKYLTHIIIYCTNRNEHQIKNGRSTNFKFRCYFLHW